MKTQKYSVMISVLFVSLILLSCATQPEISVSEIMAQLQEKDQAIDEFFANIEVTVFDNNDNVIDRLFGIRYYKKPDLSYVNLFSIINNQKKIYSEDGILVRAISNDQVVTKDVKDSFFLHDLRGILDIYYNTDSDFPQKTNFENRQLFCTFSNNKTKTTVTSDNTYDLVFTIPNFEKMDMKVDLTVGEVVKKNVYSLPGNEIISEEIHTDFTPYGEGFLPSFTIYKYMGYKTEIKLDYLPLNRSIPEALFKTLNLDKYSILSSTN